MKTWFVIPARKDSKGIKFKNRKLFNYTAISLPEDIGKQVVVSSNDEHILQAAAKFGFTCLERSSEIAKDQSSMRDVLLNVIQELSIAPNDDIILLYLTYPQRKWSDIEKIYDFFKKNNATTLSCAIDIADHPYLCYYEQEGYQGKPIVEHSLYRRQEYPKCFRQSLFVAIFKARKVDQVNDSLLTNDTIFYKLKRKVIDIDRDVDMAAFEESDDC